MRYCGDVAGRAFQTEGTAGPKSVTQEHDWPVSLRQSGHEGEK